MSIVADHIIEAASLFKAYGGVQAVNDVDLAVAEGEIFGILGANGAGKTTTVECLQGLRTPDAGSIRVCGLDPTRQRERLRPLVGSQLQDSALPDRIRVREAIDLFATGPSPVTGLLETWGLADHRRTHFARLSGGQQQRLLIILALLNAPRVVFLDELTQGLDPAARRDTWDAIREVRDRGTTVVLVTHFPDEAEELCDRLAVFRQGRIAALGTPAELINEHAHSAQIVLGVDDGVALRLSTIEAIPGVEHVTRNGDRLEIRGHGSMVAHVCAELVAQDAVGGDLRITQGTLEDAVLTMMGR